MLRISAQSSLGLQYRSGIKLFGEVASAPITTNCEFDTRRTAHKEMSKMFAGKLNTWSDEIPTTRRPFIAFRVYVTMRVAGFSSMNVELCFVNTQLPFWGCVLPSQERRSSCKICVFKTSYGNLPNPRMLDHTYKVDESQSYR